MYPMTTLNFTVSWGETEEAQASFSEVSGLTMESEVIEYRGGADPRQSTSKQAGLQKYGNITLVRGIMPTVTGNAIYAWFRASTQGAGDRREVVISLLNEDRDPAMTWNVRAAFPVKVEGPGLKSTGTDVSLEKVELACEGVSVSVP
ncbi:phage tail protein [Micrococcaceae bacterium RIT802]|nr:phage tail protein [Micrococcaceae bacterium RIT 802]